MSAAIQRRVLVIVMLAALASCRRSAVPVAALTEATGVVEAVRGVDGPWLGVAPGADFAIDDAVRTGERSSARLSVVAGGTIRLSERSRLRFRRGGAADTAGVELGIDLGQAELENSAPLSIVTAGGAARVDRGSHVRISFDGTRGTLEVIVGRAVLLPGDGRSSPVVVGPGKGVRLRIGTAVMEWFDVQVGQAVVEHDGPPTSPARRSAHDQTDRPAGAGGSATAAKSETPPPGAAPERASRAESSDARHADVTVTAGDSVVLHDGKPPLLVRLRFADLCPDGAIVDLDAHGLTAHRLSGATAVVARLSPGAHTYRLHCASEVDGPPRASGVLTVERDSGNVPLARRAPTNMIEADGRRYTVLFQTRLPALTLSWTARARPQGPFEIHVQSASGSRVLRSAEPSLRLAPGALAEGEHTWWFVAGDGRESAKTVVAIRFDNTAPTAQFFPAPPAGVPAGTVPIDGVTVKGAKVSVAGKSLKVDEHGRFQDAVAPLAGDDAVAVRIEMPHGEAHCYVKRRAQTR